MKSWKKFTRFLAESFLVLESHKFLILVLVHILMLVLTAWFVISDVQFNTADVLVGEGYSPLEKAIAGIISLASIALLFHLFGKFKEMFTELADSFEAADSRSLEMATSKIKYTSSLVDYLRYIDEHGLLEKYNEFIGEHGTDEVEYEPIWNYLDLPEEYRTADFIIALVVYRSKINDNQSEQGQESEEA